MEEISRYIQLLHSSVWQWRHARQIAADLLHDQRAARSEPFESLANRDECALQPGARPFLLVILPAYICSRSARVIRKPEGPRSFEVYLVSFVSTIYRLHTCFKVESYDMSWCRRIEPVISIMLNCAEPLQKESKFSNGSGQRLP